MASLKVASLFCGCGGTDVGLLGGFDFLGDNYAKNPMEIVYANDKYDGTDSDQASKRMLDAAGVKYRKMKEVELTIK